MVPLPVPEPPLVIVTHESETTAVHEQAELVLTETEPGPPVPGTLSVCGVIVKVQLKPDWKIVYVPCPPLSEIVPIRDCVLVFCATV